MNKIINVVLLTCIHCSVIAQNNMLKVDYFQIDDSIHVQTSQVSDSLPIYYYSEPEGGVQLLSKFPSSQGKTEVIFDQDHIPAFVLNNGLVTHLNQKRFTLSDLLIDVNGGFATITFNATTYGSVSAITYQVIKVGANNQDSCLANLTCQTSNNIEQLSIQNAYLFNQENGTSYFVRVKDSTGDILYESSQFTIPNSAAKGTSANRASQDEMTVFPSPVKTELTISGLKNHLGKPFTIYDFSGKVIFNVTLHQEPLQIDVHHLPAGHYWISCGANTISFMKE